MIDYETFNKADRSREAGAGAPRLYAEADYDDDGDLTLDPDGRQREMFDFLTGPGGIAQWEEHFGVDDGGHGRVIWEVLGDAYNKIQMALE